MLPDDLGVYKLFEEALLWGLGLLTVFLLLLRLGWTLYATRARTPWGRAGRLAVVLLVTGGLFFLLLVAVTRKQPRPASPAHAAWYHAT